MKIENHTDGEPGKMFVGGLSWETTKEKLQTYFSKYGEVVDCVVMRNSETGKSRGFGFVSFRDAACVTIVLSDGPHELDGRKIDPKSCTPRGSIKGAKQQQASKIFLGGLPSSCTETELREVFSKYGPVHDVVIMYDQEKKKSRGFGFLSFHSEDVTLRVCSEHYITINGKQVECKRAEPKESIRPNKPRINNNSTPTTAATPDQWGTQPTWGTWPHANPPPPPPPPTAAAPHYPGWNSSNYGYGGQAYPTYPPFTPPTYGFAPASANTYPTQQQQQPPTSQVPSSTASLSTTVGTNYAQEPSNYGPVNTSSATAALYAHSTIEGAAPPRTTTYHPYRR